MMKIFWGFILLGISFIQVYANDYAIIEDGNHKGLADNKGKVIIPPIYDDLGWSEGGSAVVEDVIGYKTGELWGLISTRNIKITPADFIRIIPYDKHLLIASKPDSYKLNEIYGLVTVSGKTIIDFTYSHLRIGIQGLIAGINRNNQFFFGILDPRGNNLVPFKYKSIDTVSRSIYALKDFNDQLFLVNEEGKSLLNQPVDNIYPFDDQLLVYVQEGKKGILNIDGRLVSMAKFQEFKSSDEQTIHALPLTNWQILDYQNVRKQTFDYDFIAPLDKGLYKTNRSDYSFIIHENGQVAFKIRDSDIQILNDSLASITLNGKQGVINYSGQLIIPALYDSIRIGGTNLFLFQKKGPIKSWKITDLSGTPLSDENYDKIHKIDDAFHAVMKNGFWGVVDLEGREVIPLIFDTIYDVSNQLFLVGFHGEKGVVDIGGNWKSLPRKGDLFLLEDNKYLISSFYGSSVISLDGKVCHNSGNYLRPVFNSYVEEDYRHHMGLLNEKFLQILPVACDTVMALIEDSVFLFRNGNGWGAVDAYGNILFKDDPRFQDILGCNEEYIGVKIDGEYGFVDLFGRLRIANRYMGISLYNEGLANIKILGKWGCIDKKETIVVQPYYEEILPFMNGLAIARKDGKYGIIDKKGDVRIPFEYDQINRISNGSYISILDNKSGLIDKHGILAFHPKFDHLEDLQNSYVLVQRKEKFGLMSSDGIIRIPIIYDNMLYDPINKVMLVADNPHWEKLNLMPGQ
ncbi:MAG: WG repeat-containing protein [Cyclobacteriaceae bacterium]|nr:WG repeat-containing protein [Cyclobacteriaceae bacterium]